MPKAPAPLLTKRAAGALYAKLAAVDPAPKTELDYTSPYTLLVAVVLSAQATDKGVNKATKGLFAAADTPARMVALGEESIAHHVKTIGLWRNKAKNVLALSQTLLDLHGGEVPAQRAALEKLPGVGRKTASVVLAEAFGQAAIAVDTHVFRVANRTGLANAKTPDAVEDQLMAITPRAYLHGAHHWLILHGRYVCVARTPKCPECPIRTICMYPDKTPAKGAAKAAAPAKGQPVRPSKAAAKASAKAPAASGAKVKNK